MPVSPFRSRLLDYLVSEALPTGATLPPLKTLQGDLGVSVSKLREELEVARVLGFVDVRPRTGIRVQDYDFFPAVRLSLLYALERDRDSFAAFSALRTHLEVGFWHEAVAHLTPEDHAALLALVDQAWAKLHADPVRIPHPEHRRFHLTIFARLDNPFVLALLEAFWEAYEAVEYHLYADYAHLKAVWQYHEQIARCIVAGDVEGSLVAFIEHTRLLRSSGSPGREYPPNAGLTSYILPPPGPDGAARRPDDGLVQIPGLNAASD